MEVLYSSAFIFIIIITVSIVLKQYLQQNKNELPPSPLALPVIGHFHLLKFPQHRTLKSLSDKYGPIIYLRFGNRPTVVVSSASVAEECFTKNNDVVLASRPRFNLADLFAYEGSSLPFTPYGDLWRTLRRITTLHIYSSQSLQDSSAVRSEEIRYSVKNMFSACSSVVADHWKEVNLTSIIHELSQNVLMKMVRGRRCCSSDDIYTKNFATFPLSDMSDYFPMLRWIGYGDKWKKAKCMYMEVDKFLQDLIDEGRRNKSTSPIDKQRRKRKTLVQEYLCLQEVEPEHYTDNMIKILIQFMFAGGAETSDVTLQWAMSHLLNHPEELEKARNEIDNYVTTERLIEDSDVSNLPYLRCIINETLRLNPATPLLLPHFALEDCTINGYKIPRGTTVFVNAWAIHRDPNLWEEPNEFKPERFEGIEVGKEGFKFLPFGKGRRSCPGNNLAMRFMGLALGTLIQCFEWKRLGDEMVDLEEKIGFSMHRVKPLRGLYKPRKETTHLLSQLSVD